MSDAQPNNPLHGVTLEALLTALVERHGWEKLGRTVRIRCFQQDPSIKSSLKFLRNTPWARQKVEQLYIRDLPTKNRPAPCAPVTTPDAAVDVIATQTQDQVRDQTLDRTLDRARALLEQGFCILESVHDAAATEHQERLLQAEWVRRGQPVLSGFGLGIHPLSQHVPDILPYFDCPEVNAVLEAAFQDRARLRHTGARIADEASAANIGWHHHYGWDADRLAGRNMIERVVVNFYVKGVSPALGSLWALPRPVHAALDAPPGDGDQPWPGQVEVSVPPGSAVILDTALYHTATRGQTPGMRYHWGGHYQAWSNRRPHGEDMDMRDLLGQQELLDRHPGLKRLLVADA